MGPGFRQDDIAVAFRFNPRSAVIASEAKQSRAERATLDRFVASLLAMTAERHAPSFPRRLSPEFCI